MWNSPRPSTEPESLALAGRFFTASATKGFLASSDGKESSCNVGDVRDLDSIPGSGGSSGEGNGYSNILAWRIPWTEELGGLQSMGSKRVGHDWNDLACRM